MHRFSLLLILFSIPTVFYPQTSISPTFGEPTNYEYKLEEYDRDPEAPAVVLYEKGEYTVDVADRYVRLIKKVHRKIKVFDVTRYSDYTFEIPYYREKRVQENITNFTALTHNGSIKKYVSESAIFDTDENRNWSLRKFTFPDVQDGSILEYTYQIETPYLSNIGNWSFGDEIPTIYSELQTELPGNYIYNRTLYGDQKLFIDQAEIKKSCFQPPGFRKAADCELAVYAMQHVPAYKKEPYMLSMDNYRPAIYFELVESFRSANEYTTYSKTWRNVDDRLKTSSNFGRQLKEDKYFKESLPNSILSIKDPLERAKAVYYFIQNHYTWNEKYRILSDINVKDAFQSKSGNISEINFSLLNALEAAGIDAEIMLLPSRGNALVTKQHPTLFSFNYVIVYAKIKGEVQLLDATDKFTPFGVLPMRALNREGRVLNLRKGSRWESIEPLANNMHYLNLQISADEHGVFNGNANEVSTGYVSFSKHKENKSRNINYISKTKQTENENLNIKEYTIENPEDLDQPYKESFTFTLENQQTSDRMFLYPFMIKPYFIENPFKVSERKFPVDFGFPVVNNYLISIDLKDQYEVVKTPDNKRLTFPDNDAELTVVYEVDNSQINIRLNLKINEVSYPSEALEGLQTLFSTLIDMQQNQPIELKRL